MSRAWKIEILRLLAWLFAGLLVATVLGHFGWCLFAGLSGYVVQSLYNLYRLEHGLRTGKKFDALHGGTGVWFEVFRQIADSQRRKRKNKRRLTRIVKLLQASTQAMPDGVVVLNERFEVTWANRAGRRLLGLRAPSDIGRRIDNLIRAPKFVEKLHHH